MVRVLANATSIAALVALCHLQSLAREVAGGQPSAERLHCVTKAFLDWLEAETKAILERERHGEESGKEEIGGEEAER